MRRDAEERVHHRVLRPGSHFDVDPETDPHQKQSHGEHGNENPWKADPVGPQGDHLVVGGKTPKDQQHRRQEAPRDREGHREGKHEGHKGKDRLERHIVVDEQVEHLLEDVPQHQHQTQQGDTHERGHPEGGEQVAVEDFQEERRGSSPPRKRGPIRVSIRHPDCKTEASVSNLGV